jgi:Right handed beta helix region
VSLLPSIFSLKRLLSSKVRRSKPVRPIVLRLEYLEERCTPAVHDLTTAMNFSTIQAAVNAANPGDTILADAGTYAEQVTINKSIILEGAQHGVDARTRSGAESIVDGTGNGGDTPFNVTANNVTIDGFTVQGATNPNVFGFGIVLGAGTSGAHVVNNIIQNNIIGLSLANATGGNQAVIQHNLFQNNNQAGPGSGDAIYTDQFNGGGTVSNVLIDSNTFTGQTDAGLDFSSTDSSKPATNITISNNDFNRNARGMLAFSLTNSSITANTFENSTSSATADIRLFEGVNGLTITGNLLENGAGRAVRINNEGSFPSLSNATNVTFALNAVEGYTGPADVVNVDPAGYTGALNASGNWWNTAIGANPSDATAPTAINGLVSGSVTVGSFLDSGTNTATVGFTPAATTEMWVPETAATSGLTFVDGNIQEGVDSAASGMTVRVAADTYAENVVVGQSVTLIGANDVNPVPGRTGAETIVEPGLTSSFNTDSVFVVTANNVTIEGFTIQGSIAHPSGGQSTGFTLTSGTTVYAAAGISNSTNINTGGSAPSTTNVSGLTVQNNILQDFTQVGVYGDTSDGTASTGNTIADNLITDVPNNGQGGYFGEGVIIYDDFYAEITGNKITKVRTGIQTGNNFLSAGVFAPSISGNTVSAYVKGIYFNLQYDSASTFTVSGNTITQADATVSGLQRRPAHPVDPKLRPGGNPRQQRLWLPLRRRVRRQQHDQHRHRPGRNPERQHLRRLGHEQRLFLSGKLQHHRRPGRRRHHQLDDRWRLGGLDQCEFVQPA